MAMMIGMDKEEKEGVGETSVAKVARERLQ
jgi:hypothetical protein